MYSFGIILCEVSLFVCLFVVICVYKFVCLVIIETECRSGFHSKKQSKFGSYFQIVVVVY